MRSATITSAAVTVEAGDTPDTGDIGHRQAARIAGVGYVAIFFLALFANFVVREGLVDSDDPAATVANIAESQTLFRYGLLAFVAVFIIDIAVALGLYVVFEPAGRRRSLHAAWFRLGYTVFLGVSAVFFFLALQLATGAGGDPDSDQTARAAMLAIEAFDYTWLVGLAAFGVHLVILGMMIRTTELAPRWLGGTLIAAGIAYVTDTAAHTVLANYADWENLFLAMVIVPSVIGEAALAVWLLRAGFGSKTTEVATSPLSSPVL